MMADKDVNLIFALLKTLIVLKISLIKKKINNCQYIDFLK